MRQSLSWTLEDVTRRVVREGGKLSVSTLHRIESGKSALPLETVSRVGRALGATMEQIDELLRSAHREKTIDLTGLRAEDLLRDARREAERGRLERALRILEAAHDCITLHPGQPEQDDLRAKILLAESYCYRKLRLYALALEAAGRVLRIAGSQHDLKTRAILLHVEVHYMKREFFKATLFAEAAEGRLASASTRTRAHAGLVIGALHFKQEKWQEAAKHFEEARRLYRELSAWVEVTRCEILLGESHHRLGKESEGLALLQGALVQARRLAVPEIVHLALLMLGDVDARQKQPLGALAHYELSASTARRAGLTNELFVSWFRSWELGRQYQMRDLTRRSARVLARMLRRVERQAVPEAEIFLAANGLCPNTEKSP